MSRRSVGWQLRPAVVAALAYAALAIGGTDCASGANKPSGRPPEADSLLVKVADENGAPIAGAIVSGRYPVNPGLTPSTCCAMESLGSATTGADGTTELRLPPFTYRTIEITARYRDWPAQTVTFTGDAPEARGRKATTVVLGPDRPAGITSPPSAPPELPAPPR